MPSPPARAHFRFYAELNDHLPPGRRYQTVEREFCVPASVKDMIESLGVPHTEVDLVLINGESSDFSRLVQDGDLVSVYPVFESVDIRPVLRVRPQPLRKTQFVLDVHLGKLAGYLRMLGFDTLYANNADDHELVRISRDQRRILLTRDRGLLKHSDVSHGYWVRATNSRHQLEEVIRRFDLSGSLRPFSRCMVCNQALQPAVRAQVQDRVPPRALEQCSHFMHCPGCGRVYWEGTHYRRMRQWIDELSAAPEMVPAQTAAGPHAPGDDRH
jgi:uncharacterized protein with PIN domain